MKFLDFMDWDLGGSEGCPEGDFASVANAAEGGFGVWLLRAGQAESSQGCSLCRKIPVFLCGMDPLVGFPAEFEAGWRREVSLCFYGLGGGQRDPDSPR